MNEQVNRERAGLAYLVGILGALAGHVDRVHGKEVSTAGHYQTPSTK